MGGECYGAFGGRGEAGAVVVEAFARAGDVPGERDGGVRRVEGGGEFAAFVEGEVAVFGDGIEIGF